MTKKTKKYKGWSKTQYGSMLSEEQHQANDDWFDEKLEIAKRVCVSELGMCWDRDMNKTEMIVSGDYDFIFADMVGTVGATTMSSFDALIGNLEMRAYELVDDLDEKLNDRLDDRLDDVINDIEDRVIENMIYKLQS